MLHVNVALFCLETAVESVSLYCNCLRNQFEMLLGNFFNKLFFDNIHGSLKRIPNIIDCSLKKDYQILMDFGKNILDTTGHQITV